MDFCQTLTSIFSRHLWWDTKYQVKSQGQLTGLCNILLSMLIWRSLGLPFYKGRAWIKMVQLFHN